MSTANESTQFTSLLRRLIDAYDALQGTDGAKSLFPGDAGSGYTVGAWLTSGLWGVVEEAREIVKLADEAAAKAAPDADDYHPTLTSLVCASCGNRFIGHFSKAIDAGWVPQYWIDDENSDGPACPGCAEHRLTVDEESGELVLKPRDQWTA